MTGWSSKGRRKVADVLGICRKFSQTSCSSEQTLLEGEAGKRKGFPHSSGTLCFCRNQRHPHECLLFMEKEQLISSILCLLLCDIPFYVSHQLKIW